MRKLMIVVAGALLVLPTSTAAASFTAPALQEPPDTAAPFLEVGPNGNLLRLIPVTGQDGAIGAWQAPGVIRRLDAIASDLAWIRVWRSRKLLPKNLHVRGIYQIAPDRALYLESDQSITDVDVDGSLWRLGTSSRFIDGEWRRMAQGKAIALYDGTVWSFRERKDGGACNTKLGKWQKTVDLRRSSAMGTITLPCGALPDLRMVRSSEGLRYAAAAGPAGSLYLAMAVAGPEDRTDQDRYRPGLFRIDGAGWEEIAFPDGYLDDEFTPGGMAAAPDGALWMSWVAGTIGDWRYARYDGTSWTTFDVTIDIASGLPANRGWTTPDVRFSIGPDGRAWLAAGSALLLFDGAESHTVLEAEAIHAVSVAPDGTIWVGIGNTIQQFPSNWLLPDPPADSTVPWPAIITITAVLLAIAAAALIRRTKHSSTTPPHD